MDQYESDVTDGSEESVPPSRTDWSEAGTLWNGIAGSVMEIHQGLSRTSMKLAVGRNTVAESPLGISAR